MNKFINSWSYKIYADNCYLFILGQKFTKLSYEGQKCSYIFKLLVLNTKCILLLGLSWYNTTHRKSGLKDRVLFLNTMQDDSCHL